MKQGGLSARNWLIVLGLVWLILPAFITSKFLLNILVFVLINLVLALSLSLVFGYGGQISLGQAAFYGLGAYSSAVLTARLGWPMVVGLVASVTVPAAIGYVIGRPILRLKGYYLAMATAALGLIAYTVFVEWIPVTNGYSGITGIPAPRLGAFSLSSPRSYFYFATALAGGALVFALSLANSGYGRALRAIRESETGARAFAIQVDRLKTEIFALGAGYAGLGGFLYAHYAGFISPETFSMDVSISLVLILTIGGVSSLWGAVLGAIFLTVLPELLTRFEHYDVLLFGVVVIAFMMFAPDGVYGLGSRLLEGLARHGQGRTEGQEAAPAGKGGNLP